MNIIFGLLLLLLLAPINNVLTVEAADLSQDETVYNHLLKEYEFEKSKFDKGEAVNKLELMFKGYALDAVDFTSRNFNKQLDFSEDSIRDVEVCLAILNKTRRQHKPSDEQILMVSKMYAGYIGQVIKLKWGGEWRDESEYSFNNGPALKINDTHLFLVSKVNRRILGGSEDNVWHFFLAEKKRFESI